MKHSAFLENPWLLHVCRIGLALIFLSAAIGKILDVPTFAKAVDAYRVLPAFLVGPLAHFLPWVEFLTGLCLLIDRWPAGAALLVNLMLAAFIVNVLIAMIRGLNIDCGCFTFIGHDSLARTLVRDLLFMVPALILLRRQLRGTPLAEQR